MYKRWGSLCLLYVLTTTPINALFLSLWAEITPTSQDPSQVLPHSGTILPSPSAQGVAPSLSLSVSQWGFHSNFVVFPSRHFLHSAFYYTYLSKKHSL